LYQLDKYLNNLTFHLTYHTSGRSDQAIDHTSNPCSVIMASSGTGSGPPNDHFRHGFKLWRWT